eukprot:CAMPEP_0119069380 /NCGR_PEP_ID=MMETSP1178-20130426/16080_1 /TAXON_ID=33656 /ORGANISM="unid sp, Strain CCMP2000" /LENGTH=59 /DNA_ID=CAMNT_0007051137 /DNA_START=452 /DNA_END=629 /DNA_ORIENTATION=+
MSIAERAAVADVELGATGAEVGAAGVGEFPPFLAGDKGMKNHLPGKRGGHGDFTTNKLQ